MDGWLGRVALAARDLVVATALSVPPGMLASCLFLLARSPSPPVTGVTILVASIVAIELAIVYCYLRDRRARMFAASVHQRLRATGETLAPFPNGPPGEPHEQAFGARADV